MILKKITRREVMPDAQLSGLHPVLQRIYANRGVKTPDELENRLAAMLHFEQLSGIDKAARLIADAIEQQQRILVVGDFDADGATSCAVSMLGLSMLGAEHADYLVPNRFEYGYGLTPELVAVAIERQPDLLITVDNGIANHAGVDAAKAAGMTVIVTDHHLPADTLPSADAIVNPNLKGDPFPSKHLAGVGVIFYTLLATRAELRSRDHVGAQANLAELLDLVALGTVADVVPLDKNNRVLVQQGLQRIRAGRCRPGILALLKVAGRDPRRIVATDMGFAVGPRLNAAGRLEDMSVGIECLLAEDFSSALSLAAQLDELNRERKNLEQGMKEQAMASLGEHLKFDPQARPNGVCLFDESWHQGVIGIVASRIKEAINRPVIVFAPGDEGEIKGSARSVAGVHIRDVLANINASQPHLLKKFGGHAMAAGMTIDKKHFDDFQRAFDRAVKDYLGDNSIADDLITDGELHAAELTLETAQLLRDGGPWGQHFPEPVFDGEFHLLQQRIVGEQHLKMTLETTCGTQLIDGIAFFVDTSQWPCECERVRVVYKLDVNEYQGRVSPQLLVEQIEMCG